MNKFVYFMAVGLAFTVLQVATVEAQGGVPATTADDTHNTTGEDCAALSPPAAVAACWERKSSHADGAHAGMAPGTTAMCPGPLDTMIPCTTGDANMGTGGQGDICSVDCAGDGNVPAAAVANCVAEQTAANC